MNIAALGDKILQLGKLGKLPSFILGFICWALLLLPSNITDLLGVTKIIASNRTVLGLGALVFSLYFLAFKAYEIVKNQSSRWKIQKVIKRRLRNLTEDEKVAIRPFIYENKRTQHFSMGKGIAESLVTKKILYRSSTLGVALDIFPYSIQDIAFNYLVNNPHLLD